MTSGAPWSVKGIDPKAREVAKDLARRSGMTLGEWLNQMIFEEDGPEDISSEAFFTPSETGLRGPVRTYYESARQEPPARSGPSDASPSRFEAPEHPADEISRVTHALDRLVDRIESSEGRTGLAISGVEHSVREAAARIESAEREQVAIAARFESAVNETREVQEQIANRLKRVEAEAAGPKSAEALRALETALGKVANHLYEGEARTRRTIDSLRDRLDQVEAGEGAAGAEAIEQVVSKIGERLVEAEARTTTALEGLKSSFSGLDDRLGSIEGGASPAIDQRLERLAASLTERVEAVRNELARNLQASTEGRFDRMERKLSEMTDQVRTAEHKSAQAIERLGREVTSVADTLSRRVIAAEQKSADTLGQVTTEVGRITQAMESRFSRNDTVQADAMEKLGAEINRISERLAERIGSAERRSAQAIDEVSGQLSRVTEKIGHRAVGDDIAETLRHTEDRTARLLAETKEKIDQSLAESQRQIAETLAGPNSGAFDDRGDPFGDPEPFPTLTPQAGAPKPANYSTKSGFATPSPLARSPKAPTLQAPEAVEPALPVGGQGDHFDPADFEAIDAFTPSSGARFPGDVAGLPDFASETQGEPEAAASRFESVAFHDPEGALPPPVMPDLTRVAERKQALATEAPVEAGRPLTTREVIEQARAAARAAGEAEAQAKAKKGARGASILSRLSRPKRQAGSSLQTALVIAGASAALALSAAGFMLMEGRPGGGTPDRVARAIAALKSDPATEIAGSEVDTAPIPKDPRVAIALTSPELGATATPGLDTADLADRFSKAADAVDAKKPGAIDDLKTLATQGYGPAQFYLAKMYETGGGGLKKDLASARQWTSRAAESGDRRAMHNLGIAFIEGVGGPKNAVTAAQWFRRAAELGLVDSQYNLAALYERGLGVSQNAAEAYRWYLIAAKTGDEAAHKRAEQIRSQLNPDARIVAERAATAFRPSTPSPTAAVATATAGLGTDAAGAATVQKALSRLGYYQGPTDGSASPALNLALAAYQRDQNLTPTGVLDQATVARLSVFTH
ncbi:MAG: Localization factor PodJS [Alphaproteobacteria bacterium PA2]|nr:MAG: Localization factor PodJS [Alphaproteobacteria bacterium PA2]